MAGFFVRQASKGVLSALLTILLTVSCSGVFAETVVDAVSDRGIVPQGRDPDGGFANNPVIPGESMTTGRAAEEAYVPVLVNIDNVAGAWPQWGIAQADIIYEMPIHGYSLTRLMALFTHAHPEEVGPMRSGRVMHAEMRQEWDAAWGFAGIQSMAGSNVNQALRSMGARESEIDLILNVHGGHWSSLYYDVKHHTSPHNHSFRLAQAAALVAEHPFPKRPFLFSDELPTEGKTATTVRMLYNRGREDSYTNSSYIYDPVTNLYTRYRAGKPFVDMNDPETALTFSNIIVQWTELSFNQGASNAPLLTLIGEGNADFFIGGRHIAGYWVRQDANSRTIFFDQQGQELKLQRGKSWIHVASPVAMVVKYSE